MTDVQPRACKKTNTGILNALKLIIFNSNAHGEITIYSHQRNAARDGNLDVHGVFMLPGETLLHAGMRCIEDELEGDQLLVELLSTSLEAQPLGSHSFEMRLLLSAYAHDAG